MDRAAFEAQYRAHERALQRLIYYKTPSRADGDDVLQEVALAAFRHWTELQNPAHTKAWLLRIAQNKCNDFYRARAARQEIPLALWEEENTPAPGCCGWSMRDSVSDTLDALAETDRHLLRLAYINGLPQAEIARRLGIPLGTVKSRLYTARRRFRAVWSDEWKGEPPMGKLPDFLPEYTISPAQGHPFSVTWEECFGWFIIPRLGETCRWAIYDPPDRRRAEHYDVEVLGRASVHGVEGVEVLSREAPSGDERRFIMQLTDTHCRFLAETHTDGGVKRTVTFLDADEFLPRWGFGEDNRGREIRLSPRGILRREGDIVAAEQKPFSLDVAGRYTVTLGGKSWDTVCVMNVDFGSGIVTEQFLDQAGRTVLRRRFNRDDWKFSHYRQLWSDRLPDSQRLTVGGETYVHWYDCVTDAIF
ncbi:MAG: RNA polymerase sigma factor [Oscillospiraceae bacterium]|jgi:RNA polymerase sigma-70 factor (ECF subfamily)|nr:RNA polymerase sigma factor [Oscillospiraceae bacterium]